MYALTCPACLDVRHVPFVRAAAVTRCPACQHQWAIKDRQVVREDRNETVRPEAPAVPPKAAGPAALDALDDDPKGGSSLTGLSGLSDLMQDVPKPTPKPKSTRESASAKPRAAARPSIGSGAAKPASASAPGAGAGLGPRAQAGLAVGVAAVVILLLWATLGGGDSPATDAVSDLPAVSATGEPPAKDNTDTEADLIHPVGPPMPDEAPTAAP